MMNKQEFIDQARIIYSLYQMDIHVVNYAKSFPMEILYINDYGPSYIYNDPVLMKIYLSEYMAEEISNGKQIIDFDSYKEMYEWLVSKMIDIKRVHEDNLL